MKVWNSIYLQGEKVNNLIRKSRFLKLPNKKSSPGSRSAVIFKTLDLGQDPVKMDADTQPCMTDIF